MRIWKVLGVAGVAGVAATGVAVARAERRRRAYEPDDVRARLHQRHHEAMGPAGSEGETDGPARTGDAIGSEGEQPPGCLRAAVGRVVPRRRRRR